MQASVVVCKKLLVCSTYGMERQGLTHIVHVPRGSPNIHAQNIGSVLGEVGAGDGALIATGIFISSKVLDSCHDTNLGGMACYI